MTSRALLVLSGGQDSTTCAFWAMQQGFDEVHAVTFDYGQRHARELAASSVIAELAGLTSHEVIAIGDNVLAGTSPLTDLNASLEQYEDGDLPGGLEKTFVPMRNQLFMTIAANRAYVKHAPNLITGVCQEDFGGYPDCRDVFIKALANASSLGTFTGVEGAPGPLTIHTPLMDLTKAQSVDMALRMPGCYEALAYSHTAYDGAYPPNGFDHATVLRAQGFEQAGIPDPLILRAACEGLMELPDTDNYFVARDLCVNGPAAKTKKDKNPTWTVAEYIAAVREAMGI